MENDTQVEVSLKGGALNFNYKTSLQKAAQIIAFLSAEQQSGSESHRSAPMEMLGVAAVASTARPRHASPLEAIKAAEAKIYPEKIAALGYFITTRDQRETFDPKEVLTLLRRMGDMPKNYGRDLRNAEILGYVTKEPNGEFLLTEHGAVAVQNKFADAISPNSGSKKKRSKRRSKTVDEA